MFKSHLNLFSSILLHHGAPVDCQDKKNYTPLFFASKAGSLTDIIRLIKHGANVNHIAKNGKTPLFRATSYETAMLLLNHGANPYQTIEVKDKNGNPFPAKQTVIEHLLKFGSECPKAILDASMQKLPDDTLIMDFEVFKGKKNLKEKNNLQLKDYEISLFLQAIDNAYNSLLIHPLMQIFLNLKWRAIGISDGSGSDFPGIERVGYFIF